MSTVRTATPNVITPENLIERFCDPHDVGALADPVEIDGIRICSGFCGIDERKAESVIVGFEDGFDFLNYMMARGWWPIDDKGEWPDRVYLLWSGEERPISVAAYEEGRLTVAQFASKYRFYEYRESLD
jgi:hypothetical protein